MRILVVGSGGVGDAVARIAARRTFFERLVVADVDLGRSQRTVEAASAHDVVGDRFVAAVVDASSAAAVEALVREHGATHVLNAVDPRFVLPIFEGVRAAGAHYLDMAMSLSHAHPERPYELPGVKLGDEQFAQADGWEADGQLALVGIGVEPGLSDVFARYAADHLFAAIDELGVRDGANLEVRRRRRRADLRALVLHLDDDRGVPQPAGDLVGRPCRGRAPGWRTAGSRSPPFHEPEVFRFPEPIGDVECVHVEHEEVLLMPRWVDARKVTFKYGLGEEFIGVLRTLHRLGLDRTEPVTVRGVPVSPRDVVAAALPDPATIGPRMTGSTCAGLLVTGTGKDGSPREVYLLPPGRQRVVDGRVRRAVRRVADRRQPGRRARAPGRGHLVGGGCARPRGVRRRPVPRAPRRADPAGLRLAVGYGGARPRLERAERVLEHGQRLVQEVVPDDQRREQAQHVAPGPAGEHQDALRRARRRDLLGARPCRARASRARTSSIASIAPRPRTSATAGDVVPRGAVRRGTTAASIARAAAARSSRS